MSIPPAVPVVPFPLEKRKREALSVARHAAAELARHELRRDTAIRTARQAGASLRELCTATGLPYPAVRQVLEGTAPA